MDRYEDRGDTALPTVLIAELVKGHSHQFFTISVRDKQITKMDVKYISGKPAELRQILLTRVLMISLGML